VEATQSKTASSEFALNILHPYTHIRPLSMCQIWRPGVRLWFSLVIAKDARQTYQGKITMTDKVTDTWLWLSWQWLIVS